MQKRWIKTMLLFALDIIAITFSWALAYIIKFDSISGVPDELRESAITILFVALVIKLITLIVLNVYNKLWRYAGITEMIQIIIACGIASLAVMAALFLISREPQYADVLIPRSILILSFIFDVIFIGGSRFAYRFFFHYISKDILKHTNKHKKRVLIYGAGQAGVMVLKELYVAGSSQYAPIGFLDDDISKKGKRMQGLPVYGNRYDLEKIVIKHNIEDIIIAIPSLSDKDRKEIINLAKATGVNVKILPKVYDLIEGKVSITSIRDVEIGDLLGREQVLLDNESISKFLTDKVVMVTGGGGSIGSELCRQIVNYNPSKLIILDNYENNAYDIQMELNRKYPDLDFFVAIASIRDKKSINELFERFSPEIVFHTAAHKHVPLMETNAVEAIKNNVFGTYNVVEAAVNNHVEKFVMISTDKAVNPTNIMGASKRMCEMIVQSFAGRQLGTEFVAVRFGNVLGSNGSVVPLFKEQIKEGGPVTVTHPDIIRYFMTIPEAARLVVQAGGMAKGGEIFVLDMGDPVKIITLAEDLIRLSGFEPGKDIKIKFIGLRPGEKLFEELLLDEEGITSTSNAKIFIAKPIDIPFEELQSKLRILEEGIENDSDMLDLMKDIIPTYKTNEEVNQAFEAKIVSEVTTT